MSSKRSIYRPSVPCPDDPTARHIALTSGKVALVDASDYDWLMQWNWCALKTADGEFYAARTDGSGDQKRTVYMARQIMGDPANVAIDHIRHTLDNRRRYLRPATTKQNSRYRKAHNGRRFKGVFWHATAKKWRAMIRVDYKLISLGMFSIEEDAARAYDAAAVKHYGDFARTNFPAYSLIEV